MTLDVPPRRFGAYLFDCDGTVVDSMPVHHVAWQETLAEYGCPFPEDQFYALGGMSVVQVVEMLNREHGLAMDPAEIAREKEDRFYGLLPTVAAVGEVLEVIEREHGRIPFAVVSGSTRESVTASLTALGLVDRFETLVCAEDYTHGKPNPEPFLTAAARLGVPPEDCLVFEDAELGMESARRAGMAAVKVLTPPERKALLTAV